MNKQQSVKETVPEKFKNILTYTDLKAHLKTKLKEHRELRWRQMHNKFREVNKSVVLWSVLPASNRRSKVVLARLPNWTHKTDT